MRKINFTICLVRLRDGVCRSAGQAEEQRSSIRARLGGRARRPPRVLAGFERSPPTQQPANAPQELTPPRLFLPAHQRGSAVLCRGGKPLSSLLRKSSIINVRSPLRVLALLKDS